MAWRRTVPADGTRNHSEPSTSPAAGRHSSTHRLLSPRVWNASGDPPTMRWTTRAPSPGSPAGTGKVTTSPTS